jgi:hypothetical protein
MNLPAAPKPDRFDSRLDAASEFLSVPPDKLVSIKIRPIVDAGDVQTEYLFPSDYMKFIDAALADSQVKVPGGITERHGVPFLCKLPSGQKFVYIKHESGPEIIFLIDLLQHTAVATGAIALAATQIVVLVNKLNQRVRTAPSKKERGVNPVGASSIEARVKTGQKVLKQISKTADAVGDAIKSVNDLF